MELILLLWVLFGVCCALIANAKHRSGCGWFMGGVLLGPLGLIIVACLPRLEKKHEPSKNT